MINPLCITFTLSFFVLLLPYALNLVQCIRYRLYKSEMRDFYIDIFECYALLHVSKFVHSENIANSGLQIEIYV